MKTVYGHSGPPLKDWQAGIYMPLSDTIYYRDSQVVIRAGIRAGVVAHEEKHREQAGGFFGRLCFAFMWKFSWRQRVEWEIEARAAQLVAAGEKDFIDWIKWHAKEIQTRYGQWRMHSDTIYQSLVEQSRA